MFVVVAILFVLDGFYVCLLFWKRDYLFSIECCLWIERQPKLSEGQGSCSGVLRGNLHMLPRCATFLVMVWT